LALALIVPVELTAKKKEATTYYYAGPIFHEETARVGEQCIEFGAVMTAGTFFLNFHKIESSEGTEFREGNQPVKYFPSKFSLVVLANPTMCDRKLWVSSDPELSRVMNQLQFDVRWKTGLDETPVKTFTVAKPEDDFEQIPFYPEGAKVEVWKYRIAVEAQDTPLETHLIVSVFDEHRNLIVRLSGAL